jgi:hypothetical protein
VAVGTSGGVCLNGNCITKVRRVSG